MLSNFIIQAVATDNEFKFIYLTWELSQCSEETANNQAQIMQYLFPDCFIYVFKVSTFSYSNGVVLNGDPVAAYRFNESIPFTIDYDVPVNPPTCSNQEQNIAWVKENNLWSVNLYPTGSPATVGVLSALIHGNMADMFAANMSASTNGVASICRNNRPRRTYQCGEIISDNRSIETTSVVEAEIWIDML